MRQRRDWYERVRDKAEAVRGAEAAGQVADSMDVRRQLLDRVNRGEISLEQAQAELAKIKRGTAATGQTTRSQAWRRG